MNYILFFIDMFGYVWRIYTIKKFNNLEIFFLIMIIEFFDKVFVDVKLKLEICCIFDDDIVNFKEIKKFIFKNIYLLYSILGY